MNKSILDYKFNIHFKDTNKIKPVYIFAYSSKNAQYNLNKYLKNCSYKHHNNSTDNIEIINVKCVSYPAGSISKF